MSFITLDREREIRIRNKAISLIEKRFKKTFIGMIQNFQDLTVDEQIYILYAGLKHEDPSLTVEKVEDLADEYSNMTVIAEAIGESCLEAYGTDRETAEKMASDPKMAAE